MKKLLILLSAISLISAACNKEDNANNVEKSGNVVTINSNIDLESFETTFHNDEESNDLIITFSEPEDIPISEDYIASLGLSDLTLEKGIYTIIVPSDGSHNGKVRFNIKSYASIDGSALSTLQGPGFGPGIRIAKRYSRCGECCGGIGFRCGLVPKEAANPYADMIPVSYVIDFNQGYLEFTFLDNVDFETL